MSTRMLVGLLTLHPAPLQFEEQGLVNLSVASLQPKHLGTPVSLLKSSSASYKTPSLDHIRRYSICP
jgi:hypothetical protein